MGKECAIRYYNVFNDRGSITRNLSRIVEIGSDEIVSGKQLPGWIYRTGVPVVEYYDGELIEITKDGHTYRCRAGETAVEIFSAERPENIHVQESLSVCLSLDSFSANVVSKDFATMFRQGSFNTLTVNAMPLLGQDREATVYFMRLFSCFENLFLLNDYVLDLLRERADSGDRYAMFAFGRYLLCTQVAEDSSEKAEHYFLSAYEKGLPEAAVALSQMYLNGDIGIVDRFKAKKLMVEAMEKECDFAAKVHLKDMIFGRFGCKVEPEKAERMLNALIDRDKERGTEVDPKWYHLRGMARQQIYNQAAAKEDYKKAAVNGVISAWGDYAIASSYNDDFELEDRELCLRLLKTGIESRDNFSIYMHAILSAEGYDDMPDWRKESVRTSLTGSLEKAYNLGSFAAAEYLGDIYYNAWYDIPEDNDNAWMWYAKGALLASFTCMEKMFDMAHNHYVDVTQEFKDYLALKGARLGSKTLLNETVMAYTYGRLTEFAAEIEQYYVPEFDAEEECPDDDGRFDAYV